MKTVQDLKDQFGEEGLQQLSMIDARAADLIDRLYKYTEIALNLKKLNIPFEESHFKDITQAIKIMMDDLNDASTEFIRMRGEV